MTDTGIPPVTGSDLIREAERRGATRALDRLAEKAAGDRQWEDGMGQAHAWVRDLIADVRAELAADPHPDRGPAPLRADRATGVFPTLGGP